MGVDVEVAMNVLVLVGGTVAVEVLVLVGIGVKVSNDAPGVRKKSNQEGGVSIAASTGSISPSGMLVRKSLFGLRFDPILVSSSQRGAKRTAHCPATITHRNPTRIISRMMIQSRRSLSRACIVASMYGKSNVHSRSRVGRFIVARTLQPDTSAMCIHDTACDSQSQSWPSALELGLA